MIRYFALGCLFGIVLIKSEVVSWFRIQEMFRFQAFHMYGIIGTAVTLGVIGVALIKKFKINLGNKNLEELLLYTPISFANFTIFLPSLVSLLNTLFLTVFRSTNPRFCALRRSLCPYP